MKIISSCLMGLCLIAWTSGCGCTRHGRCVEWDGPGCPGWEVAGDCGCLPKGLSKFRKPKFRCRRHGEGCCGGQPDCEMASCCSPAPSGCCGTTGMPISQGTVSNTCCGGEPVKVDGVSPMGEMPLGPIPDAGGCAGCAGGQVMMAPISAPTGNCAACGSPTSAAPQPPTTGWCASGNCGNQPTSIGSKPLSGIIYDNVTTPAPIPATNTSISAALQNAPPPPPPLPASN